MANLEIQYRVLGAIGTNVYFLINKDTKEAIVVDPADNASYIAEQFRLRGWTPAAILLTHGHFDHIYAVNDLKKMWPDVKVYAYEEERALLADSWANRSEAWASAYTTKADVWLKDNEVFTAAGFEIKVIHTPGHTAGSCCYYLEEQGVLMAGDTLFLESYGRTDLQTGSEAAIFRSINERLMKLPDDVYVYPGHMDMTSIGHERTHNPAIF